MARDAPRKRVASYLKSAPSYCTRATSKLSVFISWCVVPKQRGAQGQSRGPPEIMVSLCVGSAISPNPICKGGAPVWWNDDEGEGGTIALPQLKLCTSSAMREDRATLETYCVSMTTEQKVALENHNISSVYGLLSAVRAEEAKSSRSDVYNPTIDGSVHKKSVLFFLNNKCKGLSVNFDKLYKSGIVERGGKFPAQWLRPQPNCGMSENDAILAALLRSASLDERQIS